MNPGVTGYTGVFGLPLPPDAELSALLAAHLIVGMFEVATIVKKVDETAGKGNTIKAVEWFVPQRTRSTL